MMRAALHIFLSFLVFAVSSIETNVTYSEVIYKTMSILRSCKMSSPSDVVLLAGYYDEFLRQPIFNDIPVALIAQSKWTAMETFALTKYSYLTYEEHYLPRLIRKLDHYVVIASSQPYLRLLLQRIKDSTWANPDGYYVLIDRKTEERGCVNARHFLWTAWQYDLLSSIFMCIDSIEGVVLYTYNPFSDNSPRIWRKVGQFKGRRGHPWTLLMRNYRSGPGMCEDLNFVKIRDLNGYTVRLNAVQEAPYLEINMSKPGLDKFTGDNSEIVKVMFEKLNASLDVTVHNGSAYDLGGIAAQGNMVGMLADVSSGKVDMGMNVRALYVMWKIKHTYPHADSGLCVITQPAGQISELQKIASFASSKVLAMLTVICAITTMILTRQGGFLRAILNIVRLITCVSMLRISNHTSVRIILSNVLMLFLIINAIFQSHWSSLLTVPVSQPSIKDFNDLKQSGYAVYGTSILKRLIVDPVLHANFHGVSYEDCKQRVLDSAQAACLEDCLHLYDRTQGERFHHSKTIRELTHVYVTRETWPLFNRVSGMVLRMVETGLVSMWRQQNVRKLLWARLEKREKEQRSFRVLRLKHLSFSFSILGIGYTCASVAFLIELAIERYRLRGARNRRTRR